MKFLLTSAGLTNDALTHALGELAGKPISEISFLFIPTAAFSGAGDTSWVETVVDELRNIGFKSVEAFDITGLQEDEWKPKFTASDVICFGGGDEKYLARVISECDMKKYFQSLGNEKVYMGISAGSMVAVHFPPDGYAEILFPEDGFPSVDATPMALIDLVFLPHLNSSWFAHMRTDALEGMRDRFTMDTYATDDHTALKISGDVIEIVGGGESWVCKQ